MAKLNEPIYAEFGDKIKTIRKQKGLTQTELAKKIGTTQSTIYKIEKGLRTVPISLLEKFATVLEVSVDTLLGTAKDEQASYENIYTGNKIKNLREENKLTLSELSDELEINVSLLANFESGFSKVPIDVLIKISKYFNVSIDDLVGIHIKSDDENESMIVSKDPHYVARFKTWINAMGNVHLNDEELGKLIEYAKFLISQREK